MTSFKTRTGGDEGAALIVTIFMVALLGALAVTATTLTVNNVANAGRDKQGTSALALSEAGVAHAVSYLRSGNVSQLRCAHVESDPTSTDCGAANPWGERGDDGDADPPRRVTVASGATYDVWITVVQQLHAASRTPGIYRVHSAGEAQGSPGRRLVTVDLEARPFEYPLAVYADSVLAGGSGSIVSQSLFSTGCIFGRGKIRFGTELDVVYGIPPAAHTSQYITGTNGSGKTCSPTDKNNIHNPNNSRLEAGTGCNNQFPYDQDRQGMNPVGGTCQGSSGAGSPAYPQTSLIESDAHLAEMFNFNPEGLTEHQLELLKTAAIEQGFYFTDTTAIPAVLTDPATAAAYPSPILFYDLRTPTSDRLVDINPLGNTYSRSYPLDANCSQRAVMLVVLNGDIRLNSNTVITASLFAMGPEPYGKISKSNGGGQVIGTVYARSLDLTGTSDLKLDPCFVNNPPGQVLEVSATNFREIDR